MSNEQLAKSAVRHKPLTGSDKQPITHSSFVIRYSSFIIFFILLIATFFRFYQLFYLPPGLNFDEASNGVAALDILRGDFAIWWRIGGGKEPLWPYLIAVSASLLGNIPFALRFPAAIVGILTVAAVYPLMMALFRRRTVALYTMLGLALSAWHLHFSRLSFRAILLPLLSALAFYFLWRGFTRFTFHLSRFTFHVSGLSISALFTALAISSYLAARLLPLVVIIFFIADWLTQRTRSTKISNQHLPNPKSKIQNPKSKIPNPQFLIPNYQLRILTRFFLYLLIFLTPLIIYFILNPADFLARAGAVSIFNSDDLPSTLWQTLILTLGTFLSLTGDANPLVNLPYQPAIPLILVPFFIAGMGTSLYYTLRLHARRNTQYAPNPYLLLLCWWLVMLLPALLAPEGAPHHLRLIGAIVPTYALVALGAITIANAITKFLLHNTQHAIRLAHLLPAACYLLLAFHTYAHYFTRWPASTDFTLPLDLYATRLAADIEQTPPGAVYILPMDIRAADEARHYTLDYLMNNEPLTINNSKKSPNFFYIPVDERNSETLLTHAAQHADELRVVRWTDDKHREADAKEIITFLLETNATLTNRETFPVYSIETYHLADDCNSALNNKEREDCNPRAPEFTLPKIERPILAKFDNLLQINTAFVQPAVSPGDMLPVAMTLAPLNQMDVDYKASIRLISPSGERLLQKDRTLLHNFHQGTSLWPPETVNEYYLLPIPASTPPGEYRIVAVIYNPDTLTPLVADEVIDVLLGVFIVE